MNSNTNVLLLIIPNPSSTILAHSLFYRLFSVYGEVVKILIFEKARVWKAFVEMGNEQQAQQAQKHLDQTEVSDEVIMNVYFSNLRSVTFLNNNCGGVDYRQLKQKNAEKRKIQQHIDSTNWYSQPEIRIKHVETVKNLMFSSQIDVNKQWVSNKEPKLCRKTSLENMELGLSGSTLIDSNDKINNLQSSESFIPEVENTQEDMSPDDKNIMKAFATSQYMLTHPYVYEKTIEQELASQVDAIDLSDFQQLFRPPPNLTKTEDIVEPQNYVNPQFLIENQPSKVIYIRGLSYTNLQPVNIFNLLSNCGNVMVIIYIKQKSSALVQFEKLNQAQNAKDHLNNQPFFSQKLKIFYSNYQQIQFPLPYQSPQTLIYIPSKDQFRFGEGKSISFNPPSQTLHLSNIKQEVTENEQIIRQLFDGIGEIQGTKFMHLNQSKHMALVKLSTLEEAINGAALLHGKEVYGRKLNVSFTKSKF